MRYLCLALNEGDHPDAVSNEERAALEEELRLGGYEAFESRSTIIVRVRNGVVSVSDGQAQALASERFRLLMIRANDLNDAIRIASKMPAARTGSVEIRPIEEPNCDLRPPTRS